MGIFDGCFLASDIDGTLVYGDSLPQRNIDMIKYFVNEGGIFSVATGRSILAVGEELKNLDCVGPSVFSNGSIIFDYSKKEMLHNFVIDSEYNFVLNKIREWCPTIGIEVHLNDKVYIAQNNTPMQLHTDYEHIDVIYSSVEELIDKPISKVLYIMEEQDKVGEVLERLNSLNLNCKFVNTTAIIYGVPYLYIEQLPKDVNKASSLGYLKNNFSIKNGNFFAIGDFYNDREMLEFADISAATAEAPEDIKSISDFVTCPAKEGAVADFIDYLIRHKKG